MGAGLRRRSIIKGNGLWEVFKVTVYGDSPADLGSLEGLAAGFEGIRLWERGKVTTNGIRDLRLRRARHRAAASPRIP